MNELPLLTLIILAPLVGGIVVAGMDAGRARLARNFSIFVAMLSLGLIASAWRGFDNSAEGFQLVERHPWIPSISVDYFLGIDGMSLMLLGLSGLVTLMALLAPGPRENVRPLYYSLILLLESGLFGVFTAQNFVHWFLFWELSLIPAFFLVKLWGGPKRGPAAVQFFLYTMFGSVAMMLSFVAMYLATGEWGFTRLAELSKSGELASALSAKIGWYGLTTGQLGFVVFLGAFLGFAVKVPVFPFHAWLPATYSEAPTGATMLLTGAMSKMGVYGFLRILLPIFPAQMRLVLPWLLLLAVLTIVISAWCALAQKDLKRMLAYSSINHLGYCVLGVIATAAMTEAGPRWDTERAAALSGVLLQVFNHGLTAAALFCFVGYLEQRAGGHRSLDDFGGLRKTSPVFCGLMGIAIFASLGLPGLNGFVGEFLIFKGVFPLAMWASVLSTAGLLLTALFLLLMLQRVFWGPLNPKMASTPDLTMAEKLVAVPAVLLMFALGIFPGVLLNLTNRTVLTLVENLRF